jgi:hypothetical protein
MDALSERKLILLQSEFSYRSGEEDLISVGSSSSLRRGMIVYRGEVEFKEP